MHRAGLACLPLVKETGDHGNTETPEEHLVVA